jgi:nucleoside-diphosphate-sugar epimerase
MRQESDEMALYQDASEQRVSSSFSLKHLFALRPSFGVALRGAIDIGCVWTMFAAAWLLLDSRDSAIVFKQEAGAIFPVVGLFSLLAVAVYASANLYAHPSFLTFGGKVLRVATANMFLLAIAVTSLFAVGEPTWLSIDTMLATFAGASLLQSAARAASEALRSEYRTEGAARSAANDEKKVLVIGGAGYVGSALVERLLHAGMEVSVLDAMHFGEEALGKVIGHPNLTLIREDFRHVEALTRAMSGVGSVVHLGGLVGDPACAVDPELTVDINVTATKLVGEIAKARGVKRLVFSSSCSVYGACEEVVDETSHFNPQSLYARSKVASEVVLGALNDPNFAVTCLRFATIYGFSGRTRFDLVVNLLCAKAVRESAITVFGPDQWRPFVHVDDVARAIVATLQAPVDLVAGEAFNVGSNAQNYTLGEVAELINRQVPDARIVADADCADRRNYRVCFDKIRTRLGFEPAWTLERGVTQVVSAVRSNRVGHHSLPTYSNVLYLKALGTKNFREFKITGWENDLMSIDHIAPVGSATQSVAA